MVLVVLLGKVSMVAEGSLDRGATGAVTRQAEWAPKVPSVHGYGGGSTLSGAGRSCRCGSGFGSGEGPDRGMLRQRLSGPIEVG